MTYRPQIHIQLPHKLALDPERKVSCLLLSLSQLCLGANLIFVYGNILPIYFFAAAGFFVGLEKWRRRPMAQEAIQFCIKRIFLHFLAIVTVLAIQVTVGTEIHPLMPWNFLIFTLVPLSIYEAFALAEGRLGITFKLKTKNKK